MQFISSLVLPRKLLEFAPPTVQNVEVIEVNDDRTDFMNSKEAEEWNRRIGKKIDHQYDHQTTPMQTYRYVSWILSGVLTATSIGLEMAFPNRYSEGKMIAHAATVASLINVIVSVSLTDLNSPKERQSIVNRIASQSFEQIAQTQYLEDVIDYGLLNDEKIGSLKNSWARPILYKKFSVLFEEYKKVETVIEGYKNMVSDKYRKHVDKIRETIAENEESEENSEKSAFLSLQHMKISRWDLWQYRSNENVYRAKTAAVKILNECFANQKAAILQE